MSVRKRTYIADDKRSLTVAARKSNAVRPRSWCRGAPEAVLKLAARGSYVATGAQSHDELVRGGGVLVSAFRSAGALGGLSLLRSLGRLLQTFDPGRFVRTLCGILGFGRGLVERTGCFLFLDVRSNPALFQPAK